MARRRLVVFGGDYQGTYPDDTWLIDLTSSSPTWVPKLTTGETPPGSYKASLIHDVDGDRAILYGGSRTTDVFALDLEAFNWSILVTANKPANRYGHAAVYDAAGQRMVVFGGKTAAGATSEVWELSLVPGTTPTWTMLTPIGTGPSPRDAVRAAWDEVGRRMFVFGAWPPADDMWILSLASTPAWTRLYPTNVGASARTAPGFVWDAPRSRLIVVAGRGNDMMHSDAWALPILGETAGAWELLQPDDAGPTARDFFPMVLDPVTLWAIMPNGADSWNLALADCL